MSAEAKVGVFVIACMLFLIAAVYYVGNARWGAHFTSYKTYLRYAGGVAPGTDVLFGGIRVGSVTGVQASKEDPTRIQIALQIKQGTPLNQDSVARLGSVSLMSSPAVSITTGSNNVPRLREGEVIPSEETVSIDEMTRKLSGLADGAQQLVSQVQGELKDVTGDARRLLANLNDVTGPSNRRQVSLLLQRVNSLVAAESPKIDHIADELLLAGRNANTAIQKIDPVLDHADATVVNVNATIDQLRDPIRQDLLKLRSTMDQATTTLRSIQVLVQANDPNISETVENLRIASDNLDQLTEQVKQRPWSLVRIRQQKGRKVPQ